MRRDSAGPDNYLYLVIGNHAWAKPSQLSARSPLTRLAGWPAGDRTQGKPKSTEDVLLPLARMMPEATRPTFSALERHYLAAGPRRTEREPVLGRLPQSL